MYKRLGNYEIGFKYIDLKTNKNVSDENVLEWIKSIKIPPAYNEVMINHNRQSKILAYGYDSKGRKQCMYHPEFTLQRSNIKFEKILKSHKLFYNVHKTIKKDIYADGKIKEMAIVLYLIIHCGFRVGNKKYERDNNSYGVTTIKFKHISFDNKDVIIDFVGKKGVQNKGACSHPEIVRYLKEKHASHKADDNVFMLVTSHDVNTYLKKWGSNISSKDLRTWNANFLFVKFTLGAIELCHKKPIKYGVEKVAEKLHNTVAVCKKNYIDPKIVTLMEEKLKI